MKVLAYILTAAVVLVGADVFVMSSGTTSEAADTTETREAPQSLLTGGSGIPTPPPDAY